MKYAIGVDPGKRMTKAYGKLVDETEMREVLFKTRLHRQSKSELDLNGNSHLVAFDGEEYILGDQGEETDPGNSKTSLLHKLAIYTATAQFLEDTKDNEVVLTVSCPASIYKNNKSKEDYRQMILNNGTVNVGVNESFYEFGILKVFVRCEGTGIVYMKPDLFRGKRVGLLDIGSRNYNFAILENGGLKSDNLFCSNLGSMALEAEIKDRFIEYALDDSGAEQAIMTDSLIVQGEKNEEATKVIQEVKSDFVSKIINEIATQGTNLSMIPLVVIGGTSINLRKQIKDQLKHSIMLDDGDNPQTVSAKGLAKVSLVKASNI